MLIFDTKDAMKDSTKDSIYVFNRSDVKEFGVDHGKKTSNIFLNE